MRSESAGGGLRGDGFISIHDISRTTGCCQYEAASCGILDLSASDAALSSAAVLNVAVFATALTSLILQFVRSSRSWFNEHKQIRRLGGPLGRTDQRWTRCGQRFDAHEYQPTAARWICWRYKVELSRPVAYRNEKGRILLSSIKQRDVAAVFESYPPKFRRKLLALRRLVLNTAKSTEGVGRVEETLKWGEPAYLTPETKSGSTIRIAWKPSRPTQYAMYFHCQTNLVTTFRELFPDYFRFDGNRAIVFHENDAIPKEQLSLCIAMALTYHLTKDSFRG